MSGSARFLRTLLLLAVACGAGVLLGSTTSGEAAQPAGRSVAFAQNAGAVNGIKASRTPVAGRLLALNANRRLPASVLPAGAGAGARPIITRVYGSRNQNLPTTIAGSPPVRVRFDRVSFDTSGMHDASRPTVLSVKEPGIYLLTAYVHWNPDGQGDGANRAVSIVVGDHYIATDQRTPGGHTLQTVTTIYRLERGEEVSVAVGHDSRVTTGLLGGTNGDDATPSLTVYRLSA